MGGIVNRVSNHVFFEPVDTDSDWGWPATVPRASWTRIPFDSQGAELVGVFGPAEGDPGGVIVLAHPKHASAKGFVLRSGLPAALRERGYDVFAFDFNGFGESELGSAVRYPDLIRAVETAAGRSEAETTAALGISMGGSYLVPALVDRPDLLDAAVFDSVSPTTVGFLWQRDRPQAVRVRLAQLLGVRSAQVLSPVRYADAVRQPSELLFVFGENDPFIQDAHRRRLREAFPHEPDSKPEWVAPNTRHNTAIIKHTESYADQIADYVDRQR